jgi:demethylmenaquinone methyltransferase/2-methoxy-6-polyprenyl-1,4-benzoquinol methylase
MSVSRDALRCPSLSNKYLAYDDSRASRVRALFSRIAYRYDLLNDVMSLGLHRRWKREAVRLALGGAAATGRVLDLCCGSGDLCFLAERAGARAVTGVDFTLPMVAVARRRKRERGSSARLIQADALALPFGDRSFDAVTISYGLRNVADLDAALREMRRVLVPGGRAVILEFGKPERPFVAAAYRAVLGAVASAVGRVFHGDKDTYLYIPASLERYPGQRGVEELMRRVGFRKAWHRDRLLGTMSLNVGDI